MRKKTLLLATCCVLCLTGCTNNGKTNQDTESTKVITESTSSSSEEEMEQAITEENEYQGTESIICKDGYQFTIPGDYDLMYTDDIGTVIYMPDVFQMKMAVVEKSYDEVMQDTAYLTSGTTDAGGTITQDVKETSVDGKNYAYYKADLNGNHLLVIYTAAPDAKKRIAGQIALLNDSASDEDMVNMFASIAGSAVTTDQPDSTKEDIDKQIENQIHSETRGEMKTENTMVLGNLSITHKIPDGYYSNEGYTDEVSCVEFYYSENPYIDITCSLFDSDEFDGAEQYVKDSEYFDDTKMNTMEINGRTCYYTIENINDEGSNSQQLYAGIDLGDHQFYILKAYVSDENIELTLDMVKDFLMGF